MSPQNRRINRKVPSPATIADQSATSPFDLPPLAPSTSWPIRPSDDGQHTDLASMADAFLSSERGPWCWSCAVQVTIR